MLTKLASHAGEYATPAFADQATSRSLNTTSLVNVLSPRQIVATLFYYQGIVKSIYDGDTLTVDIDMGLGCWIHNEKLRLLRINAPEVKGESRTEGLAARQYLRSLLAKKEIVIETYLDDKEKFGRFLAEVWALNADGAYFNVNDAMVQAGHAIYKEY